MCGGKNSWICCQLGARDHYSIARGLHERELLDGLITDVWVRPGSSLARLPGALGERLRQRYDQALADANVLHSSVSSIAYEARRAIAKSPSIWDRIIARNDWFQANALRHLRPLIRHDADKPKQTVFAYSYAAREILRTAREFGCTTILGQIDPGPAEERLVAEVCLRNGNPIPGPHRVPDWYWENWQEECDLCDSILVNSSWTRTALIGEGVPSEKIHVLPLAYDPPEDAGEFVRAYPTSFSTSRPLRILFLGSLIPRKGIYELLDATALLRTAPVEFRFVGSSREALGVEMSKDPQVHWFGPVPRKTVYEFYRSADVFILPTHSDGFGLTQLEAMAWGLPVIASRHCGKVVTHHVNGLVLSAVDADAIVESIEWCLKNATQLVSMSNCAQRTTSDYRTSRVIEQLLQSIEGRHDAVG